MVPNVISTSILQKRQDEQFAITYVSLGGFSVFKTAYNPWRSLLRATHPFFAYSNGELHGFTYYLVLNSKWGYKSVCRRSMLTFLGVIVPPNATNASFRLYRPLAFKEVKTRASAANSSSIKQSILATTINKDLRSTSQCPESSILRRAYASRGHAYYIQQLSG